MKFLASAATPILVALGCVIAPKPSEAIPAFARKYNVKCYQCHTIPPALNKTGYIFKRLGYRFPPDNMDGTKPAPKIADLDKDIPFRITNAMALVTQTSFTAERNTANTPQSTTSFNLDEAALFVAGAIPTTNFSFYTQYELFQDGQSDLEQANAIYTGGRANSSYFVKAGEMHMQEGEGTRAAMFYNLFPTPAPLLTNIDPINFSLDQHPVGVDAGYTYATNYFKRVLAVSAKVTNGLNPDGSEIMFDSNKNAKDVWLDADYWYADDAGVTFMTYYGSKYQDQNQGGPTAFTFEPVIRRYGVFGNYMFFDKLDVLGGYLHARDDWKDLANSPTESFISNGFRGEVDYYVEDGFALMARYDRMNQYITGQPTIPTEVWGVGAEKAVTERGNVVVRATYQHARNGDPVALGSSVDKLFMLDVRLMW